MKNSKYTNSKYTNAINNDKKIKKFHYLPVRCAFKRVALMHGICPAWWYTKVRCQIKQNISTA